MTNPLLTQRLRNRARSSEMAEHGSLVRLNDRSVCPDGGAG